MYQYDDPTVAASLPTPAAPGTAGYFTDGNPGGGVAATILRSDFMNMVMLELLNIVTTAGLTPGKTTYNQINQAIQKMYAPPVATVRNLRMYVSAASSTATLTADEVVVGTALGGQKYIVPSVNLSINLAAAAGAGAMDTGSAPVNGYVGIYLILNPVSGAAALLAVNTGPSVLPNIYASGHMPSGYTASALIAMVPTNGSGQFKPVLVQDRVTSIPIVTALTSNSVVGSLTPISLSAVIPPNAKSIGGELSIASTSTSTVALTIAADSNSIGQQNTTASVGSAGYVANYELNLATPQTLSWSSANTAGTPTYNIFVSSYTI